MMDNELIRIGAVVKPHGIKGAIKVYPTTDEPKRFEALETILIGTESKYESFTIEGIQYFKQLVILTLHEVRTMDQALDLQKKDIFITREEALPLEEDEYFIYDLIGLKVYTDEGEFLGLLKDILQTGSNDVYVVEKKGQKDLLIPVIKQCIQEINMSEKKITVTLMEGLR